MPAPFSRDCQVGSTRDRERIAAAQRRGRAAEAQEDQDPDDRRIGLGRAPRRRGGYTEQIEDILEQAIKGLDVVMINRGVSGELAAQAALRIKNEVALNEPDLVLWQVGTNDALAYVPLDELETTIVDTIHWLKEHKVDVVLVGLQYVDRMAQDDHYRAGARVAAQDRGARRT